MSIERVEVALAPLVLQMVPGLSAGWLLGTYSVSRPEEVMVVSRGVVAAAAEEEVKRLLWLASCQQGVVVRQDNCRHWLVLHCGRWLVPLDASNLSNSSHCWVVLG